MTLSERSTLKPSGASSFSTPKRDYAYYHDLFRGQRAPFAFVDLDYLQDNIQLTLARAGNKRIRLATKSLRSVGIIQRILDSRPLFHALFVLLIYVLVSAACVRFLVRKRRERLSIAHHIIIPILGMLVAGGISLLALAQPGPAPLSYIPFVVGCWLVIGLIVTIIMWRRGLLTAGVSAHACAMYAHDASMH